MPKKEIREGDVLLLQHENNETAKVRVLSILSIHGEKVLIVSINDSQPVHIDEETLSQKYRPLVSDSDEKEL